MGNAYLDALKMLARRELSEAQIRQRLARREHAGIASATARSAVDEVFADVDADALLEESLSKRMRGHAQISDRKEFNRLYRYLVGQGFEPERVLAALKKYN